MSLARCKKVSKQLQICWPGAENTENGIKSVETMQKLLQTATNLLAKCRSLPDSIPSRGRPYPPHRPSAAARRRADGRTASVVGTDWLRTNGVNTNGAAARVTIFVRLGKKVRPGTFGSVSQQTEILKMSEGLTQADS